MQEIEYAFILIIYRLLDARQRVLISSYQTLHPSVLLYEYKAGELYFKVL